MHGTWFPRTWARRSGRPLAAIVLAGAVLTAATPARALDDGEQLLVGGNSGSAGGIRYTAPGLANIYGADFPGTGLGEQAAQIRMTAGTLEKLRVNVVTQGNATSGNVAVTVRINEADTVLTCTVGTAGGDCGSGGKSIAIANGDKLAVEVASTLDAGFWSFTFSMIYD